MWRQRRGRSAGGAAILAHGKIRGYPVVVISGTTNAIAAFGKWADMLICEWLGPEIAVNPFANFPSAILGTRGWIAFNAAPLVATSFAVISGIT